MGCIHPLEVAGVIAAPVSFTLRPCQQLRFIYIHSCFPENCTVNTGGLCCALQLFVRSVLVLVV